MQCSPSQCDARTQITGPAGEWVYESAASIFAGLSEIGRHLIVQVPL
jgi:hypothetical protein